MKVKKGEMLIYAHLFGSTKTVNLLPRANQCGLFSIVFRLSSNLACTLEQIKFLVLVYIIVFGTSIFLVPNKMNWSEIDGQMHLNMFNHLNHIDYLILLVIYFIIRKKLFMCHAWNYKKKC